MKRIRIFIAILFPIIIIGVAYLYLKPLNIAVLNPKGEIALREKNLLLFASFLSLFVLVPVYALLITFAIKYNEKNTKAKYSPNFDRSRTIEALCWGIPAILIILLSIVTWQSSHELDPYKPITSNNPTLNVEVVAMDWKWLFIYPDYQIASVNNLTIPINTPVNLKITSDAPMNQIWIPQLAGQVMTMPGMITQLNLIGNTKGSYLGRSTNISGSGFAGMTFKTNVVSDQDFNSMIAMSRSSNKILNIASYQQLSKPSENVPISYYSYASADVFSYIYNKYMSSSNVNISSSMGN